MTDPGWIKLHRILLTKRIWKESPASHKAILITLLLKANHSVNEWTWKGLKHKALPGQFVTSMEAIAEAAGSDITRKMVRSAFKNFVDKYQFMAVETDCKINTMVTIHNWQEYQFEPEVIGPVQGVLPLEGITPPAPVPNTDKKIRKKSGTHIDPAFRPSDDTMAKMAVECSSVNLEHTIKQFVDYWTGTGKPMADWEATFRNWVRKNHQKAYGTRPNPIHQRVTKITGHDERKGGEL